MTTAGSIRCRFITLASAPICAEQYYSIQQTDTNKFARQVLDSFVSRLWTLLTN